VPCNGSDTLVYEIHNRLEGEHIGGCVVRVREESGLHQKPNGGCESSGTRRKFHRWLQHAAYGLDNPVLCKSRCSSLEVARGVAKGSGAQPLNDTCKHRERETPTCRARRPTMSSQHEPPLTRQEEKDVTKLARHNLVQGSNACRQRADHKSSDLAFCEICEDPLIKRQLASHPWEIRPPNPSHADILSTRSCELKSTSM
jgi:hypothetical protein